MSKLPKEHRFIDFSDYGRPLARLIKKLLKNTSFTQFMSQYASLFLDYSEFFLLLKDTIGLLHFF